MRKGQTKQVWTPEQKSEFVHKHLDDHVSVRTLEREHTTDRSMIFRWMKKHIAEGESAFIYRGHPVVSFFDFGVATAKDVPKLLGKYVHHYNNKRPATTLGYKSPVQYKAELGF